MNLAGGARYGTRDWLAQRASAAYMLVYTVVMIVIALGADLRDFAAWQAFLAREPVRIATLLFWIALLWHAWIGMRDVLMDYVRNTLARLTLHVFVIIFLLAMGLWAVRVIWRI